MMVVMMVRKHAPRGRYDHPMMVVMMVVVMPQFDMDLRQPLGGWLLGEPRVVGL